jgi:hypothetical protein
MTLTATMAAVEHYTALAQQAADQAADRAAERRERAAARVTFDDVLEKLADMDLIGRVLMSAYGTDRDYFESRLVHAFDVAFERATDDRIAQGN